METSSSPNTEIQSKLPKITREQAIEKLVLFYQQEVERKGKNLINSDIFANNINKTISWLYDSNKQGLLLCGTVGNGKTTLARAVIQLINLYNKIFQQGEEIWRDPIKQITAYELSTSARESKERFEHYKNVLRLFIDDVGVEESGVKNYGNVICPFAELLFERYDKNKMTIITTNLTIEQITSKYDNRVADRIKEMFWRITFTAPSYRK